MIDFERLIGFEWDDGNARKSSDKHGVSQSEAEQVFFNDPLLFLEDILHSGSEQRLHALGRADTNRLLHVAFMLRHERTRIRVISARSMSRKERAYYAKAT